MNRWALPLIIILYLAVSAWGLNWGLYSFQREQHLFPAQSEWNAQRVADIMTHRPQATTGAADVDPNAELATNRPVVLNDSEEEMAEIFTRYLLYSHQPDEMITFRALARMNPREKKLDPQMYQYGGLFIYPIGALLQTAAAVGLVHQLDLQQALSQPEQFARYYLIARMYVVIWGVLGVWATYAIGNHMRDWRTGSLAALWYALLPVVTALSHEAKPHLPGTVLMLWSCYWALKYLSSGHTLHRLLLAIFCGLAVGMVLTGLWILVLIPLVEMLTQAERRDKIARSFLFLMLAGMIYCVCNPYVLINLFSNREVLFSNLTNSADMYHLGRWPEGLINACRLLLAGSSPVVVLGGLFMLVALWAWDWRKVSILTLPALLGFFQFSALAAGKPGEYGRFAIFPNVILGLLLTIGFYEFLIRRWYQQTIYSILLAALLAWPTLNYLSRFTNDRSPNHFRYQLASHIQSLPESTAIGVLRDPAPYGFPPIDFSARPIIRLPTDVRHWPADRTDWPDYLLIPFNGVEGIDLQTILSDGFYQWTGPEPHDPTPLSWSDRPLILLKKSTQNPYPPAGMLIQKIPISG